MDDRAARAGAAPRCVVHVRIDAGAVRADFAQERPPVLDGEWDAPAYVAQRAQAYREALSRAMSEGLHDVAIVPEIRVVAEADIAARIDAVAATAGAGRADAAAHARLASSGALECPASAGDRVHLDASPDVDAVTLQALRDAISDALRPVFADAGAWRRFLGPAYFERHRAWRSAVGSPIQH